VGFKEISDLTMSPGKIALAWINSYSGIMIKTPKTTIIFDPVRINSEENIQVDIIVVTHEHLDHYDPVLIRDLQKKTSAMVLTTPFISAKLLEENTRALVVGNSFIFNDVEFHAERCDHPANQPLSFVLSTADGVTVYHPSDGDPFPEMAELGKRYKPDILLYFGTALGNAARIAKLVKASVALAPYTDAESQKKFAESMKRNAPITQAKMIKRFEIYEYPN